MNSMNGSSNNNNMFSSYNNNMFNYRDEQMNLLCMQNQLLQRNMAQANNSGSSSNNQLCRRTPIEQQICYQEI